MVNLLKNACEAGGETSDCAVKVTTADSAKGVTVCVCDNGPGIPPGLLPTLFEAKVSTKPDGMGIGLSISRTIVEAHQGSIRAENLERGARICFTLPGE